MSKKHKKKKKKWLDFLDRGGKKKVKSTAQQSLFTECHSGTIRVFQDPISKIDIYGGGDSRDLVVFPDSILIDVGAQVDPIVETSPKDFALKLQPYSFKRIRIRIQDGSTPDLSREFWADLIDILRKEKKDVIVACLGGHGRTGMVLSILAVLMNATDHDPVKFVRDNYCEEAVETGSQIKYIEKITQIEVTEKPSGFSIQYGHYGNGWGINGAFDEDEDEDEIEKYYLNKSHKDEEDKDENEEDKVNELDFTNRVAPTADEAEYFVREIKRRKREKIKQGID